MLPLEHSATLLSLIKLPFVIKIFVLSIFEWQLTTGFIVFCIFVLLLFAQNQQFFSHVRTNSSLPGLDQYYAEDKVSNQCLQ